MTRKLQDFWWTWREGDDWPSWYYGEPAARDGLQRLTHGSPGRKVSIGTLNVDGSFMVSGQLLPVD